MSPIETQGQRLASDSCVAKARAPKAASEGMSPVSVLGEGRNPESPIPLWEDGFQTKMKEGRAAFSRDPSHGSYIRRKSKTPEGGASREGCRDEHRMAKRRGERGTTAPPGGASGQGSGGTSGSQEELGEAGEAGAWWVTTGHCEGAGDGSQLAPGSVVIPALPA